MHVSLHDLILIITTFWIEAYIHDQHVFQLHIIIAFYSSFVTCMCMTMYLGKNIAYMTLYSLNLEN